LDVHSLPKVALHDHLDGGLRASTLLELGRQYGVALPGDSALALGREVAARANSGSLVRYLEAFGWTIAVMQTAEALTRIAREAVEDLAADGVVLAELRFAPLLHTSQGLTAQDVINAVSTGISQGSQSTGVPTGLILCALRCNDEGAAIVDLYQRNRHGGVVVGVDLAGPEAGYPVSQHPAFAQLAASQPGAPITLHAGEAAGVDSIWEAINAGARRIGHGVRLIDDILADRALLSVIRERNIHLEVCLSSNVQTGAVAQLDLHPVSRFLEEGVRVSLDADNRLISATSHSQELGIAKAQFGVTLEQMQAMTCHAIEASFLPEASRQAVLQRYAHLLAST
jgi:adenosine deaminase